MYKTTGKRTPNLQAIYKGMLTVKPTSTENERVFSTGNIVSKIRNRLSDETINAFVFLNAYFNNNYGQYVIYNCILFGPYRFCL